jgi:hypothetical protein
MGGSFGKVHIFLVACLYIFMRCIILLLMQNKDTTSAQISTLADSDFKFLAIATIIENTYLLLIILCNFIIAIFFYLIELYVPRGYISTGRPMYE